MKVTIEQIALAAGVSRGTVDRALNNRGRIDLSVKDEILSIANDMGYQPNRAARALAMVKQNMKIGVLLQSADTPFMSEVLHGVQSASAEIGRMGVSVDIRTMPDMNPERAVSILNDLIDAGCNGIALVPSEDSAFLNEINRINSLGIPIVTFNADIKGADRLCFVGQDSEQSGRTAAGLMACLLSAPQAKLLVISGYPSSYCHQHRINGFLSEIKSLRPNITLIDTQYNYDDDVFSQRISREMLREFPDLDGIYIASAGVVGVCKSLAEKEEYRSVKVISHDLLKDNIDLLKQGYIQFLLGQDAYTQGYQPVHILFDKLIDGKDPKREHYYTGIEIVTRYNC